MRIVPALIVVLQVISSIAQAQCVARAGTPHPHLVELYTSEGCSSCPPAERWLRGLSGDTTVIALEFHVDYWDSLGWRDRFASPRYTARQQKLAARAGSGIVYTPEVALDGREWRDWYRDNPLPTRSNGDTTMTLAATRDGSGLHVRINTDAGDETNAPDFHNYVALTESGVTSKVSAGENRGELLHHDHVVRAFAGPLPLARAEADLAIPADVDLSKAELVAFAQSPRDGEVSQVVTLPLGQCQ